MHINRVFDWYNKAYYRTAQGMEQGRRAVNILKGAVGAKDNPEYYKRIKNILLRIFAGNFYWPTTYPTSIDASTGALLYSLVRLLRPEYAVEIGTYKGNAAICIGQALKENTRGVLETIDPVHQDIVDIAIRKSRLTESIHYHSGYSYDVLPKLNLPRIDFAFIDGDHSYESVRRDFELIAPQISSTGVLVFHDIFVEISQGFDGPRRVIEEMSKAGEWEILRLPTEVGANKDGVPMLDDGRSTFRSVGLAVCQKK